MCMEFNDIFKSVKSMLPIIINIQAIIKQLKSLGDKLIAILRMSSNTSLNATTF